MFNLVGYRIETMLNVLILFLLLCTSGKMFQMFQLFFTVENI